MTALQASGRVCYPSGALVSSPLACRLRELASQGPGLWGALQPRFSSTQLRNSSFEQRTPLVTSGHIRRLCRKRPPF